MVQPIKQSEMPEWRKFLHHQTPAAPAKLKPNFFARVIRWSWQHAYAVLGFWLIAAIVATVMAIVFYQRPVGPALVYPTALISADSGAETFGRLTKLQVLTLSNSDPQELLQARDSVIAALLQRNDLFALVFAPGAGDFYDEQGMLYRPIEEVQARVAYALSLKPLFDAVKDAPESASMATLLGAMATAVTAGRDPQGLDGMMEEAAVAVQSLNIGEDHALDWAKIADLQVESLAKQLAIYILPREGKEVEARAYLANVVKASGVDSSLTGNTAISAAMPDAPKPIEKFRLLAALLMGAAFCALVLAIVLGRFSIAAVIFAPNLVLVPLGFALVFFIDGASWPSLWPVLTLAVLLPSAVSLGLVLSAAEHGSQAGLNNETALMVAAHHDGKILLMRGLLLASPFIGLVFLPLPLSLAKAALVAMLFPIAMAASFSLPPALSRIFAQPLDWRALQWLGPAHRGLFETGQWQFLSHVLGGLLIIGSLVFVIAAPRKTNVDASNDVTAVLVASDKAAAEQLIERLRLVPSAVMVQWLGSFLPEQASEKLASLQRLQGQFPRIEPVGFRNPVDVRDVVDTMQESLGQIAQSPSAGASLKQAAQEFRQSLVVLAATSDDSRLEKLDNRLFGGFNRIAEKADALAAFTPPNLETLPVGLHVLFGNAGGPFRLVVTPVDGVGPGQLAQTLDQLGFPVVHPAITAGKVDATRKATLTLWIGVSAALALVLLALAAQSVSKFTLSVLVGLAAAVALTGGEALWQQGWTLQWLLGLCVVCAWALSSLAASPPLQRATLISAVNVFLLPGLLLMMGVPLTLLGLEVPARQILPMAIDMLLVSIVIGLFQRHGAAERDFS